MQLHAEMPMVQRRVVPPVALIRQRQGHIVTQEIHAANRPVPTRATRHGEQPLAGGDENRVGHVHPPESAWNTWIAVAPVTGSDRRARSRITSPSMKMIMCLRSAPWSSST